MISHLPHAETETFDCTLPSGRAVTFRAPLQSDRRMIQDKLRKEYRGEPDAWRQVLVDVEMYLPVVVITAIDGMPPRDPDFRYRVKEWTDKEYAAYLLHFRAMTELSDEEQVAIREEIKRARGDVGSGE